MPVVRPAQTALPDQRDRKPRPAKKFMDAPPANGAAKQRVRQFDGPPARPPAAAPSVPLLPEPTKTIREKKPKLKTDPALVAKARELRDRWLEHVNAGQAVIESSGKYDVTRVFENGFVTPPILKALPSAA
jgi:hypothetical protein